MRQTLYLTLASLCLCCVSTALGAVESLGDLPAPFGLDRVNSRTHVLTAGGSGCHDGRVYILRRGQGALHAQEILSALPAAPARGLSGFGPVAADVKGHVLTVLISEGNDNEDAGCTSQLWSSVLQFVFSKPVLRLRGAFVLTEAQRVALGAGQGVLMQNAAGEFAWGRRLVDLPDDGNPVAMLRRGWQLFIADASGNSILRSNVVFGGHRTLVQFPDDSIPNGMTWHRGRLAVSLFGDFLASDPVHQVVSVHPWTGASSVAVAGLFHPIDVVSRNGRLDVLTFGNPLAWPPAPPQGSIVPTSRRGGLLAPVSGPTFLFPNRFDHVRQINAWLMTQPFLGSVTVVPVPSDG